MEESFFGPPRDVTALYQKKSKDLPRYFVFSVMACGATWAIAFATGMWLIKAIALLWTLGLHHRLWTLRRSLKRLRSALSQGPIIRRIVLDGSVLRETHESSVDGKALDEQSIDLQKIAYVSIEDECVSVSIDIEEANGMIVLTPKDFEDRTAMVRFVTKLLELSESSLVAKEPSDPLVTWSGKF